MLAIENLEDELDANSIKYQKACTQIPLDPIPLRTYDKDNSEFVVRGRMEYKTEASWIAGKSRLRKEALNMREMVEKEKEKN